jgi:hypothetical protein
MYCGGTNYDRGWTADWTSYPDALMAISQANRKWHHTPAIPLQAISGKTSCILAPGDISEYNNGKDDDEKLVQQKTGGFKVFAKS